MQIIILSLTCIGLIVSIDAMRNSEAPAPPGLPEEHYDHIDLGCTFHAQIRGNKYVERGLLRKKGEGYAPWVLTHTHMEQDYMAEGLSVYLDVQDVTSPYTYSRPTKFFKAALVCHPTLNNKPIRRSLFFIDCPAHKYPIKIYEGRVSYRNHPSEVDIRPLVGNGDETYYIKVKGFIEV